MGVDGVGREYRPSNYTNQFHDDLPFINASVLPPDTWSLSVNADYNTELKGVWENYVYSEHTLNNMIRRTH